MIDAKERQKNNFVFEFNSSLGDFPDAHLREKFSKFPVIIIRNDGPFEKNKLKAIAKVFGNLFTSRSETNFSNYHSDQSGQILNVSNRFTDAGQPAGVLGNAEIGWHSDLSHLDSGFDGSLLYNVKNGHLADLCFCDTRALFSALPDELKEQAQSLTGLHSIEENQYPLDDRFREPLIAYTKNATQSAHNLSEKPVVRKNISQQPSLYLSPATLVKFQPRFSPRFFLKYLQPSMLYQHRWQPHDIIIYNNISTMHKRSAFNGDRLLYRINFNFSQY